MSLKSTLVLGSIFAALATTSTASAIDFHVSGDDWGVWVRGVFDAVDDPASPGSTHYSLVDGGSGVPMDFDLTLPDGTHMDGSSLSSRMITADISGDIGDDSLDLLQWSVWVEGFGIGVHVTWVTSNELLSTGVSADGTHNYASDSFFDVVVDIDYADGTTDSLSRGVNNVEFGALPTPGATALFGLAGLATARRRR